MKHLLLTSLVYILFVLGAQAQNVNIPDPIFKAVLVADVSINSNLDTEIQITEANAYNGVLNVASLNIQDLTGIEQFTALSVLDCGNNLLFNLDVSNNTLLFFLDCKNNLLTSLNFSTNLALSYLDCSGNQLVSLNVQNGNNINFLDFFANANSSLTCIQVDSVAYSTVNWLNIDSSAIFSTDCNGLGISNNQSIALMVYPNPTTGELFLSNNYNIVLTDLAGKILLQKQNTNQLDISLLPAGFYLLHTGENKKQTFKIIKE